MFKGNWRFILAVMGFLGFAGGLWAYLTPTYPILHTDEYQKAQDTKYSPGQPRCYPSRLARLPERQASDERYRCENAADERRLKSDDLVQQTRAADAAGLMVGLAYSQSLMMLAGTIFGLLTLIAAFAAVVYAKRAAEAAEGGVEHSKRATETQLRPYVTTGEVKIKRETENIWSASIQVLNEGITPSGIVTCNLVAKYYDFPLPQGAPDFPNDDAKFRYITAKSPAEMIFGFELSKEEEARVEALKGGVMVRVKMSYRPTETAEEELLDYWLVAAAHDLQRGRARIIPEWAYEEPEADEGDESPSPSLPESGVE